MIRELSWLNLYYIFMNKEQSSVKPKREDVYAAKSEKNGLWGFLETIVRKFRS